MVVNLKSFKLSLQSAPILCGLTRPNKKSNGDTEQLWRTLTRCQVRSLIYLVIRCNSNIIV